MKNKRSSSLFLLPSLIGVMIFYCIPFILSFYYTFINNMSEKQYVGVDNYIRCLSNTMFMKGLTNQFLFIGICIPLCLVLGMLLAVSIQRIKKGRGIIAILLVLPLVIPSGATIHFWKCIFDINGLINRCLYELNLPIINWYNRMGNEYSYSSISMEK